MAEMMYSSSIAATGGDLADDNNSEYYGANTHINSRPKLPGLYVGNLTWWTTDQDVINAINSTGVHDVQEVKFFENRNNGQSRGFCVVTFASEASLPIVMEKLPKYELYGQKPLVTPYTRQSLNQFELQTKARAQINNNNNGSMNSHAAGIMGISSISGVHAGTQGMPYSAGGMNAYGNQGQGMVGPGTGGLRQPSVYHGNMRMQIPMRNPRPMMRGGTISNPMSNGSMIPGGMHQMNRVRFMQPQLWNSSQGGAGVGGNGNGNAGMSASVGAYNSVESRMPPMNSSRRDDIRDGSSRREKESSTSSSRRDDRERTHRDDRDRVHRDDRDRAPRDERDRAPRDDRERIHRDDRERLHRDDRERSHRDDRERTHRDDRDRESSRSRDRPRSRSRERKRERRY